MSMPCSQAHLLEMTFNLVSYISHPWDSIVQKDKLRSSALAE